MRIAALLFALAWWLGGALRAQSQPLPFDAHERLFRGHGLIADGRPVGVPLGGLGTGRIDLCADGGFRNATLGPVAEPVADRLDGFRLRVERPDGSRGEVSLARGTDTPEREVERLMLRGIWPRAFLRGEDDGLGVTVTIEAFAPVVPHDLDASTWPALGLLVTFEETAGSPARAALGTSLAGDPRLPTDVVLMVEDADDVDPGRTGDAVSAAVDLPPRGRREALLVLGWATRDHPAAARFADPGASARAFLAEARALRERVRDWQRLLYESGLPRWYAERLCNDLCALTTNTRVDVGGVLATAESGRGMDGITGTIDQRRVSSAVTSAWYPALDRSELRTFAERQRDDGQVAHHVGSLSGPLGPDEGFLDWPDLACSFALQVARHWLATGDSEAIAPFVPHVRRGLQWVASLDSDGDGIPEGGSTYDYARAPRGFVYTASLAQAGFAAGERLGRDFGDEALATLAAAGERAARAALVDRLWNGRWFVTAVSGDAREGRAGSHLSQLAGEWTARAFGLGPQLPDDLVRAAAESLVVRHGRSSPWIPPLEVDADGRPGAAPWGWLHYTVTDYAALLLQLDRADEAFATLRGIDAMLHGPAGDPFKVGLYYDPVTGSTARDGYEWYMSSPASWWTLAACAGLSLDLPRGALGLAPSLPHTLDAATLPLFAPTFTARLHVRRTAFGVEQRAELEVLAVHGEAPVVSTLRTRAPVLAEGREPRLSATLDGAPRTGRTERAGGGLALVLDEPITLAPGTRLVLELAESVGREVGRALERAEAERRVTLAHDRLALELRLGARGVERLVLRDPAGHEARLDVTDLFQLVVLAPDGGELDIRTDASWKRGVVVREVDRQVSPDGPEPRCVLAYRVDVPGTDGPVPIEVEVTLALVPGQASLRLGARVRSPLLVGARAATLRFPRLVYVDPGTVGDPLVAVLGSGPGRRVGDPVHALDHTGDWLPPSTPPGLEIEGPNGACELRGASPADHQRVRARGDGRGAVSIAVHTALAALRPDDAPAVRDAAQWLSGGEAVLRLR